jgi:hypothetical protein
VAAEKRKLLKKCIYSHRRREDDDTVDSFEMFTTPRFLKLEVSCLGSIVPSSNDISINERFVQLFVALDWRQSLEFPQLIN